MDKYINCSGCPNQPNCMYLYMRCVEWCEMWQPGPTTVSSSTPISVNLNEIMGKKTIPMFQMNRIVR